MIDKIKPMLSNIIRLEQINDNVYKIETPATFINGEMLGIFFEKKGDNWILTDQKQTLKYMHELYELKSPDVKMCISNIIKIYGFSISGGTLIAEVNKPEEFNEKLFDYIMCIGQLANMFAFFDKP